jgi:hypothetical protein
MTTHCLPQDSSQADLGQFITLGHAHPTNKQRKQKNWTAGSGMRGSRTHDKPDFKER